MFPFLLVVHALIAAALVTVILMQKSEGGGLGMGGSPSGLMSGTRCGGFLTRATGVLAGGFILMSVVLAMLAATHRGSATIDISLAKRAPVAASTTTAPANGAPFASAAQNAAAASSASAPADNSAVPLAR